MLPVGNGFHLFLLKYIWQFPFGDVKRKPYISNCCTGSSVTPHAQPCLYFLWFSAEANLCSYAFRAEISRKKNSIEIIIKRQNRNMNLSIRLMCEMIFRTKYAPKATDSFDDSQFKIIYHKFQIVPLVDMKRCSILF